MNGFRCRAPGTRWDGGRKSSRAAIISWLSQAPLILADADVYFYRRFLRSLTRQVRYLRHTVSESREGAQRLQALIALTYAALSMAGQIRHMRAATKKLGDELESQVLPDGGHVSRNPGALIELLIDLLPLKQAFSARNIPPPAPLLNAIDRMMPMLRFFRHGDGNFALFNGMGPTAADLMATILAYDDARGEPVAQRAAFRLSALVVQGTAGARGYRHAAAAGAEPGGACQRARLRVVERRPSHRGQLRIAGNGPRKLAAGGARDRRAFHRDLRRFLLLPFPQFRRHSGN